MIDYRLLPSLEMFASIATAISLWTSPDIGQELEDFALTYKWEAASKIRFNRAFFQRQARGKTIVETLKSKVDQLPLPGILKSAVNAVLIPIGNEIIKTYDEMFLVVGKSHFAVYLDHICWTPWGKIDRLKTVEPFLLDERFRIVHRYMWACNYCCGEYESVLWTELSEQMRGYCQSNCEKLTKIVKDYTFSGSWHDRKDDGVGIYFALDAMLRDCVPDECLSVIATTVTETDSSPPNDIFQRVWTGLSDGQRGEVVKNVAEFEFKNAIVCCQEVLFFLISRMTNQQLTTFFENNGFTILLHVINDPHRHHLLPFCVNLVKDSIFDKDLYDLVVEIASRGFENFEHVGIYQELFKELWVNILPSSKNHLVECGVSLVRLFVASKDASSINLLLEYADDAKRKEMTTAIRVAVLNYSKYKCEDWRLLDPFFKELNWNEEDVALVKVSLVCYYYRCMVKSNRVEFEVDLHWALSYLSDTVRQQIVTTLLNHPPVSIRSVKSRVRNAFKGA